MNELLGGTAARAARYLEGIQERSVTPSAQAVAGLDVLDEPLPDGPSDPADVLALLDEVGSPATMATAGPPLLRLRHRRLAAGHARRELARRRVGPERGALGVTSPVAATLEEVALRWLVDLLRPARGRDRRVRHRRDDRQLHRARRRAPRACSRAPAGTSRRTASSARRRSPSSSARRRTRR